jgi:hypothetical protein
MTGRAATVQRRHMADWRPSGDVGRVDDDPRCTDLGMQSNAGACYRFAALREGRFIS